MSDRHVSRRSALAAAVGIATTGVALGQVGEGGLTVDVTNEGGPAVVDVRVERRDTADSEASTTVEVPDRASERTSLSVPAGRYTVEVAVDGAHAGTLDVDLQRRPTGTVVGPGVAVHLEADGSRAVTLA